MTPTRSLLRLIQTARVSALAAALAAFAAVPGFSAAASAETVLFIGNSFTFGAGSPVRFHRPQTVTDLNGEGIGGVPALFKSFSDQAGLNFAVSLETSGGKGLDYHFKEKAAVIGHAWDRVVTQVPQIGAGPKIVFRGEVSRRRRGCEG